MNKEINLIIPENMVIMDRMEYDYLHKELQLKTDIIKEIRENLKLLSKNGYEINSVDKFIEKLYKLIERRY